jgi:hypothetical protein
MKICGKYYFQLQWGFRITPLFPLYVKNTFQEYVVLPGLNLMSIQSWPVHYPAVAHRNLRNTSYKQLPIVLNSRHEVNQSGNYLKIKDDFLLIAILVRFFAGSGQHLPIDRGQPFALPGKIFKNIQVC